jgi:hypothetical protein
MDRKSYGAMLIPLDIGENRVKAVFDTGSPNTYLDISIFRQNKALFEFVRNSHLGDVPVKIYKTRDLNAAGHRLNANQIVVMDFSKNPVFKRGKEEFGELALLGMDVIKSHTWHFDLKSNRWAIE